MNDRPIALWISCCACNSLQLAMKMQQKTYIGRGIVGAMVTLTLCLNKKHGGIAPFCQTERSNELTQNMPCNIVA